MTDTLIEKRRTLRVREHRWLPIGEDGLGEEQVRYLWRLQERRGVRLFDEERRLGRRVLRFRQFVGAVALPGGQTLEVLPKIGEVDDRRSVRRNLMRMLAATGLYPAVQGDLGRYERCDNLLEAYLRMAADLAWGLVHQGLTRDYVREHRVTPFIKGRWRVARQLSRHAGRSDRHEVALDLLVEDTPHMRFLKAGLAAILRLAQSQETQRRARMLLFKMDGIGVAPLDRRAFSRLRFDRRHARWRELLTLLAQLAADELAAPSAGTAAVGPAWLFDMNHLFEVFIAARLRRVCPDEPVLRRSEHHLLRRSGEEPCFRLLPDIVVGDERRPTLIIDTKWKRLGDPLLDSVCDQDVRQVFAYGKIYRAPRVVLLYPAAGHAPRQHALRTNESEGSMPVTIAEAPVGFDQDEELDRTLTKLLHPGRADQDDAPAG